MDSARHADDLQGLGRPNGVLPVPRRPEGFLRRPTAPSSAEFQQEATQNPQNPVAKAPLSGGFQQETTRVHEATTRVHEATTRVHEATTRVHEATSRVPEPARRVHETTSRVPETTSRVHETTTRGPNMTQWTQNRQQRDDQQDEDDNFRPASLDLLLFYFNKLSWVGLGHLARGVKLPPARGLGSRAIRLTRTHRPRIANNETTNRTKTINFVLPLWIFFCFILTRSPWQPNNT